MKCPKCGEEARDFRTREGVEMNFCFKGCKGLWFDANELAIYTESARNVPDVEQTRGQGKVTEYDCPRCENVKLTEIKYYHDAELLVDWCGQCQGVFLDARELAQAEQLVNERHPIAERLQNAEKFLMGEGFLTQKRRAK